MSDKLPHLSDDLLLALAAGYSQRELQRDIRDKWRALELQGVLAAPRGPTPGEIADAWLDLPAFAARHLPGTHLEHRADYQRAWARRNRARKRVTQSDDVTNYQVGN